MNKKCTLHYFFAFFEKNSKTVTKKLYLLTYFLLYVIIISVKSYDFLGGKYG